MSDKSFGDPKLLGELFLCLPSELANGFGFHLALYLPKKNVCYHA